MDTKQQTEKYLHLIKFVHRATADDYWTSFLRKQIQDRCNLADEKSLIRHPAIQEVMLEGLESLIKTDMARIIDASPPDPLLGAIGRLENEYQEKHALLYHEYKDLQETGKILTSQQAEFIRNVERNILKEIRENILVLKFRMFRKATIQFRTDPIWSKKYDEVCLRVQSEMDQQKE